MGREMQNAGATVTSGAAVTSGAPSPWVVEAQDLVLRHGDHLAVRRSSFRVPRGAVTAVIGPNGSGKSTLLQAMAGVLAPSSGTVQLVGQNAQQTRDLVSFVMQSVVYPEGTPMTVRDVVRMGRYPSTGWFRPFRREDKEAVRAAMAQMNVTDLADRHLDELSGGQRQRVYVAQGIAQGHELLMLDEPMTGLDLVSARTIDELIHAETDHGHTVVLTTHDLDEARAADHVLLMGGRVVASGPPEQVLTRENLESVYGLGTLHRSTETFIDDPECGPGQLPEVLPEEAVVDAAEQVEHRP